MRALLAITGRELRERWTLPLAAFGWGFGLLFLVRYVDVQARPLAAMTAVPAAWTVAVLMGSSVIARDLADGRLAFFFARPVPWWSIAGGKLLAGLLIAIATPIAGMLAAVLFDWNPAKDAEGLGQLLTGGGLALMLVLLLGLVGFGHVASVVYRARSTWAAIDFLLFGGCVWGGVWLFYAFKRLGVVMSGPPSSAWALLLPLLLVAAVPLAAAAAQVASGRSDLRRGHKALSLTFWSGVLVWVVVLGGLLARERAVTPAALAIRVLSGASSDGRLVGIFGSPGPGREAAFVYDTSSGRSLRLGLGSWPAFSTDGRHVAWLEEPPFWRHDRAIEIQLARLDGDGFGVETVELDTRLPQEGIVDLALSPRADRLAIVQLATLSVFEVPSGRTLSTTAASDGTWMAAAFLPGGQLRAFRRVRPSVGPPGSGIAPGRVEVVSMSGGVPASAIRLEAVGHAILISPPEDALALLHEPIAPRRVSLHDVGTGRLLRSFSGEGGYQVIDAYLFRDGRVALVEASGPSRRLRLAQDGQPDRLHELPEGSMFVGGELPGRLLSVGRFVPKGGARLEHETLFVACDTGELRGHETGLFPVRGQLHRSRVVSDAAAQLFLSDTGELVRLDAETRQPRVVLPAPPVVR